MTDEQRQKLAEKTRAKLIRKAAVVQGVLATEGGQELMRILREEFLYDVRNEHAHGTGYRVGTADVIGYLMQLNDLREG